MFNLNKITFICSLSSPDVTLRTTITKLHLQKTKSFVSFKTRLKSLHSFLRLYLWMLFRKWHEQVQTSPIKRRDKEIKIHFKHYYYLKKRQYKTTDEQDARYINSMFSNLDGDEHDDHPLQSETVFLTEMIPHQVCYFSAMLKLLVHNLENKHWVRRFSARVAFC